MTDEHTPECLCPRCDPEDVKLHAQLARRCKPIEESKPTEDPPKKAKQTKVKRKR